jgi:hypothetical protein
MKGLKGFRAIILSSLLFVALIVTGGCKKSSEAVPLPSGELTGTNGCKGAVSNSDSPGGITLASSIQDCVQYQYDGNSQLILNHINAGFNCCPGQISADIQISGNTITITEAESQQGCKCLCLFDVDYLIQDLTPGTYTIILIGLYLEGGQHHEFSINLNQATSDTICIDRGHYPWDQ